MDHEQAKKKIAKWDGGLNPETGPQAVTLSTMACHLNNLIAGQRTNRAKNCLIVISPNGNTLHWFNWTFWKLLKCKVC